MSILQLQGFVMGKKKVGGLAVRKRLLITERPEKVLACALKVLNLQSAEWLDWGHMSINRGPYWKFIKKFWFIFTVLRRKVIFELSANKQANPGLLTLYNFFFGVQSPLGWSGLTTKTKLIICYIITAHTRINSVET